MLRFENPSWFSEGLTIFRQVQPKTPVVAVMEDLDSIIRNYAETNVLNILDGMNRVDNIVFLASTNYPELLGARIVNRPSRFDKRIYVGFPSAEARMMYFKHIMLEGDHELFDLDRAVKETTDLSIAHLKELFISVVINDEPWDKALRTIRSMKGELNSKGNSKVGFRGNDRSETYGSYGSDSRIHTT